MSGPIDLAFGTIMGKMGKGSIYWGFRMSIFRFVLSFVISLSLLAIPAIADDFNRINKKTEFLQAVQGKKVTADWGWVSFGSDGKLTGKSNSLGPVAGNWKWKGKFYCRNITVGGEKRPYDCLSVHVSGNDIVFIRERGKGDQMHMKIK